MKKPSKVGLIEINVSSVHNFVGCTLSVLLISIRICTELVKSSQASLYWNSCWNDIPLINDCFKIDSFKSIFILNEKDDEIVPVGWKAFSLLESERNSNAISQVYVIWRKLYQKRFIQKSLDACDVTTQNLLTSMYRISLTAVKAS